MMKNIKASRGRQEHVDLCYSSLCSALYAELDKHSFTRSSGSGKNSKHQFKGKPFWNCELSSLWADVKLAEKFLKCQDGSHKKCLRN